MKMKTSAKIAVIRKEKRLTIAALAQIAGVKPPTASRWESDQFEPKTQALEAICEFVGISVEQFTKADSENELLALLKDSGVQSLALEERCAQAIERALNLEDLTATHSEFARIFRDLMNYAEKQEAQPGKALSMIELVSMVRGVLRLGKNELAVASE